MALARPASWDVALSADPHRARRALLALVQSGPEKAARRQLFLEEAADVMEPTLRANSHANEGWGRPQRIFSATSVVAAVACGSAAETSSHVQRPFS